jgi:hypothetical protein
LNVNALLPRFWDRMVIADAFGPSYDMLDTTNELDTGEWPFVSYKASKGRTSRRSSKRRTTRQLLEKL